MNDEARKMLDEILSKEPAALTEADIAFLRARRSYLSEEHLAVFAKVLKGSEPTTEVGTTVTPDAPQPGAEAPAPRGRKSKVS